MDSEGWDIRFNGSGKGWKGWEGVCEKLKMEKGKKTCRAQRRC